jgi:hypothetical protein
MWVGEGYREWVQTEKFVKAPVRLALVSSYVPRPRQRQRPARPTVSEQWLPPAHSRHDQQAQGKHQFLHAALLLLPIDAQLLSVLPVPPVHLPAPPN